ncbi:MAG: helix-turn-helix domain-containing protein [Faecalibacterium prausnitzii]
MNRKSSSDAKRLVPAFELLQSQFRQTASGKSGISSSRSRLLVQQMIQYIEKHYQEKVMLNSLAEQMGYNPSYLSQLFRDNVGVNFYDYVTRKRLRSQYLPCSRPTKILDIAADSGFQDIKAFNTKFKEVFGRTPSEYRRSLPRLPFHAGRKALTPMWNGKIPLWSKS